MAKSLGKLVIVAALLGAALPAHAMSDPMIEGAKQCTRYLPRYEREYNVPVHLLAAIASTESGRWHEGLRITLPWPWTINAGGKSYYYNSKEEAVRAATAMQMQGIKSMDVGCMQVNMQHHPNAFASLEEAFDPEKNVAYASSFLHSLYDEQHTWHAAAAAYHSKVPGAGQDYVNKVYDHWNTILDRVRLARLSKSQDVAAGGLTPAEKVSRAEASKAPAPVHYASRARDGLLIRPHEEIRVRTASYTPSENVTFAEAQGSTLAPLPAAPAPKVIHISAPAPQPAAKPEGPRFIFND